MGVSLRSDFNLLRNCSFNIAIYVQIPKTDNWIAWFTGTYIFSKWCLKNPRKYECNHWNTRWWQDWGVVSLQGRGQFTLKIQWNKVWSTAVPNNSRHDDGTLQVEAGLMMVFPSKSYLGYKKTKPVSWSSCVCTDCLCKKFASASNLPVNFGK